MMPCRMAPFFPKQALIGLQFIVLTFGYEDVEDFTGCDGMPAMRGPGGNQDELAGLHHLRLTVDGDFKFAFKNVSELFMHVFVIGNGGTGFDGPMHDGHSPAMCGPADEAGEKGGGCQLLDIVEWHRVD